MRRVILTAVLIGLVNVLAGCYSVDSGQSQLVPAATKTVMPARLADAGESDLIEQTLTNRQAYQHGLEALIGQYTKTGNNMKLRWAKDELKALKKMPRYNYVVEAGVAGPKLKASATITEADYMYYDALRLEKKARRWLVINDDDLLRIVLQKYNYLIRKHPTSDKIDDAAFRAAGVFEHFKDYTIALLYYQRAYQWDPDTIHPAKYKAAYILDIKFHRRAEAMELYQQALKQKDLKTGYREFAEKRLMYFTQSGKEEK